MKLSPDFSEWKPSASIDAIKARASLYRAIRNFFGQRDILEVETPILSQHATTDPYIESIKAGNGFLHTSPEFAMKRLLCAGSGSIYQLCKTFRNDENGRWHNPEFTMLEWYRVEMSHWELMEEVSDFLVSTIGCQPAEQTTYQQIFQETLDIDPLTISDSALQNLVNKMALLGHSLDGLTRDDLFNLLFSHCIEPMLGMERPIIIAQYPASQSALATINENDNRVADRFEVFFKGVELANGFNELADAKEQQFRFELDNKQRIAKGQDSMPIDGYLLEGLSHGLPPCAGVALGIDRLLMIKLAKQHINDVITFSATTA